MVIGLGSGTTVVMYASTEADVQRVRTSKDLPGMAGFQQELKQHMRRQRGSSGSILKLPSGIRRASFTSAIFVMCTL